MYEVRIQTHSPEKYLLIDTDTREIWGVVPDHGSQPQDGEAEAQHLKGRWTLIGRS